MPDSYGDHFPGKGFSIGYTHQDAVGGGIYRYLGGDPSNTSTNWLLIDGELKSQPDTSGWGTRQNGARWFNTTDGSFYGWNGSFIIYIG